MANQAGQVARILYKELVEGDLRKIQARSNDADTGGGARDFRFGSYKTLLPVIRPMFPQTVKEVRRRGGQNVQIDVFKGSFSWRDAQDNTHSKDAYFEPPTDVRPLEGRIPRVHEYPCFDASHVKIGAGNRVLLLLIQLDDGSLWPHYAEERSLRTPNAWHPVVAKELLDCLDAERSVNQAAIGYRDFTNAGGTAMASEDCKLALKLLARSRNVLVSGSPGTGKSKLLAEVALVFEMDFGIASAGGAPKLNPMSDIPIPPAAGTAKDIPAPTKIDRKVFRTVFHQNSKYRDFVSGITPAVNKVAGAPDFTIVKGTLYRASEHAKGGNGAALLIIDEINRGPAVQVFGGAIVAIESDKRLASDGTKRAETQFFEMLDPASGDVIEYALPHDLYILAAMNQADASVEPLDVAFLRRWEPLRLDPDEAALRTFYGLGAKGANALPDVPANVDDALEASVRAWVAVNAQIALGRGPEFQVGHGVLMSSVKLQALSVPEALGALCVGWAKVRAHVEEVFFGDTRGIAAALNALDGPGFNPFKLTETTFADDLRFRLEGPTNFEEDNIYAALRAFANPRG